MAYLNDKGYDNPTVKIQLPNTMTYPKLIATSTMLHWDSGIGGTGNKEQQTDCKLYYSNASLTLQINIQLIAGLINMLNVSASLVILEVMILVQLLAVSITIPRYLRNLFSCEIQEIYNNKDGIIRAIL